MDHVLYLSKAIPCHTCGAQIKEKNQEICLDKGTEHIRRVCRKCRANYQRAYRKRIVRNRDWDKSLVGRLSMRYHKSKSIDKSRQTRRQFIRQMLACYK